jgi:hypothetical protein
MKEQTGSKDGEDGRRNLLPLSGFEGSERQKAETQIGRETPKKRGRITMSRAQAAGNARTF